MAMSTCLEMAIQIRLWSANIQFIDRSAYRMQHWWALRHGDVPARRGCALTAQRGVTLDAAFIAHPGRFNGIAPPTMMPNCSLNSRTNVSQPH